MPALSASPCCRLISQTGPSFNIDTYGELDWVIAGVNQRTGGTMISSTGTGPGTTLVSATPGGISLDFRGGYPYFTYNDGALPTSSAPSPGDISAYQYDKPAVDISVPAGRTRLTFWIGNGYDDNLVYKATLTDGTTTGAITIPGAIARYLFHSRSRAMPHRFSLSLSTIQEAYLRQCRLLCGCRQPCPSSRCIAAPWPRPCQPRCNRGEGSRSRRGSLNIGGRVSEWPCLFVSARLAITISAMASKEEA